MTAQPLTRRHRPDPPAAPCWRSSPSRRCGSCSSTPRTGAASPATPTAFASRSQAEHVDVALAAPAGVGRPRPRAAGPALGPRRRPAWERHGSTRCASASSDPSALAFARAVVAGASLDRPRPDRGGPRPRPARAGPDLATGARRPHDPRPRAPRGRGARRRRPGAAVAGRRRARSSTARSRAASWKPAPRGCRSTWCRSTSRSGARPSRRAEARKRARPRRRSHGAPARPGPARTRASGCWPRPGPRSPRPLPGARLLVVGEAYESADLAALEACPGVEVRRGFVPEERSRRVGGRRRRPRAPLRRRVAFGGAAPRAVGGDTRSWRRPRWPRRCTAPGPGPWSPSTPTAWAEALVAGPGRPSPAPSQRPHGPGHGPGHLAVYREVLDRRARGVA